MVSVLTEAELEHQEAELTRRMNETRDKKTQTAGALAEAKREVDHFRDSYEIVLAEDKALDKAFKKEFSDQDVHTVEQLYKLFKRRPRSEGSLCPISLSLSTNIAEKANNQIRQSEPNIYWLLSKLVSARWLDINLALLLCVLNKGFIV